MSALGHVWTAPPWQELSELLQHWSGGSCVRPVLCGGEAAGHNALRGSGPNQKHAFKDALTQTGSPDPGSTLSALRRHVLANSFKLQTPSSFPGLTSLNRSGFDANQSIALRCRRVGAVHSIKNGRTHTEHISFGLAPRADIARSASAPSGSHVLPCRR